MAERHALLRGPHRGFRARRACGAPCPSCPPLPSACRSRRAWPALPRRRTAALHASGGDHGLPSRNRSGRMPVKTTGICASPSSTLKCASIEPCARLNEPPTTMPPRRKRALPDDLLATQHFGRRVEIGDVALQRERHERGGDAGRDDQSTHVPEATLADRDSSAQLRASGVRWLGPRAAPVWRATARRAGGAHLQPRRDEIPASTMPNTA
jgi:hypothetical protein